MLYVADRISMDKKGRPTEPNDALQMALQRSFAA
eukprot:symbB.v1.2.023911.t1/scaffold2223.1/size85388/1